MRSAAVDEKDTRDFIYRHRERDRGGRINLSGTHIFSIYTKLISAVVVRVNFS